jgi:long-chain fatty acid transport protein
MKQSSLLKLSLLALGAPATGLAGGIGLYEIATPDLGLASAGYAARAQDASTVFKNPAGMSLLSGAQVQAGMQLLYGSVEFSPNGSTSARLGSDGGGNAIGALPALSAFFVLPLSEKISVGFGTFSNFGLAENYNDNWVGRYFVQKSTLVGVSLMPSLSYKVNDWLSLGAGLNAMAGYLNTEVAVNNLDPRIGDGQLKLKDNTWGFGANVGVLLQPCQSTRIGVTYLSAVKLDFSATPSYSNLGPAMAGLLANPRQIDLGMKVPQSVMVSGYHELSAHWALMADVGWQDWSQFGKVDVSVGDAGLESTLNSHYQDTWHGAVGAQYRPFDKWQFTAGTAFDSSAVSSADRTVTVPMGQTWRFGVGAQWQVSQKVNLGAAYEYMWCGSMSVDQGQDLSLRGRVAGAYDDAWFSFATLNLNWKF